MIKINSLNKYFNKGKQNEIHVINDISLELPSNGMVAIFGKSGCGKTTLLNTIGGLDNFKSGNISIDENDITNNTDNIRNKYIGYIFQNYNLNNNQSCFNNVADALKLCGITNEDVIKERVMASLKNVGMEKYYKRTPDSLSGGQQQRIAIARAIVKNPKIILADEPTGNLDENNTILIMNLLKAISKEHLVVLVTHEESLVNYYCNKIIHLSDGKVVNIEDNYNIENFNVKNKNNIYLGDLDKESIKNDLVEIDYYGEPSIEPINLKIINNDGKLYIKIDSPKIQILDHNSETKIKEGKFNQNNTKYNTEESIDMSNLPPIVGTKYGKLFKKAGIEISVHAPYYINFANPDSLMIEKSNGYIIESLKRMEKLGAKKLVFHPGTQMKMTREEAFNNTYNNIKNLIQILDEQGFKDFYLCPETMGKRGQIGTVEEIAKICSIDERIIPTLDFGHINSFNQGILKTEEDFAEVFKIFKNYLGDRFNKVHIHFSKIEYGKKGEIRHLTFDDNVYGPNFEPLAKVLNKYNIDACVVSESAGTQTKDACTMHASSVIYAFSKLL